MTRASERLIDVLVLGMLLAFGYAMREIQPALAGVITAAAVQFWLSKNATSSPSTTEIEATALAAAKILEVARAQKLDDFSDLSHVDEPPD